MIEIRRAICPYDCPDACALLVSVKDGRVVGIRGDPTHPITQGFVCPKVKHSLTRLASPSRLLFPMERTGPKGTGEFKRITWDQALDRIATAFERIIGSHGAEAILPCFGSGTTGLIQMYLGGTRFFARLGAAVLERAICSEAGKAGCRYTYGSTIGADPEGCVESRLILLWGANPVVTNLHFVPIMKEAKRRGASVVLIDPRRTRSAGMADRFYQIHPGTDGLLALGLMKVLIEEKRYDEEYVARSTVGFEALADRVARINLGAVARVTGIGEEEIRDLARLYGMAKPALIRIGIGLQHHDNGGMTVRAIACLPALVGAWGVRGGGLLFNNNGAFPLSKEALLAGLPVGRGRRTVNINQVGAALTESPPTVHALYVYNGNPVHTLPDQRRVVAGLAREDLFTVVHEQVMTDTARFADILLPATAQFEQFDLHASTWHYYLSVNRPCVPPPEECKSNFEVFQLLARRLGLRDDLLELSPEAVASRLLVTRHPFFEGISFLRLMAEGSVHLSTTEIPFVPFADGRFPTPSGTVEFYSEAMARDGLDPLPNWTPPSESALGSPDRHKKYPLTFLTPSARFFLNSTFADLSPLRASEGGEPVLEIHPDDAAPRAINSGDLVQVGNDRGVCFLYARVTRDIHQGTVASSGMWWGRDRPGWTAPNATTSCRLSDLGRGSTFNTNLVEVARIMEEGR
jgi:anaerobic selenocysteine-containing dehydrogenase